MDFLILTVLFAATLYLLKRKDEHSRIRLLAAQLSPYHIEKLMETLTQGYLRALGEKDAERRELIWRQLSGSEARLSEQFAKFAAGFSGVAEAQARVSRLPIFVPFFTQAFPQMTFDVRRALALHAQAIALAAQPVEGEQGSEARKKRAFTLSAEMLLMQHTCHWFCKSKSIASARMRVRHQTSYDQLLASVAAPTRKAYLALVAA